MGHRRLPTEQRREQLADAALSILTTEGARAVTVKNIAQAVGITDGAVFRHFSSKQELLDAAVSRFVSLLPPLPSDAAPPIERLGTFFVERVTTVRRQPEILGLAMSDRLEEIVGETAAKDLQRVMRASFEFIAAAIKDAKARGLMPAEVSPKVAAWMITGAMRGTARDGVSAEQAWNEVRGALFRSPSKKAASTRRTR